MNVEQSGPSNIREFPGGGEMPPGNGGHLRERVARLENETQHLATKTDIQQVLTKIEETKNWFLLKMISGIVVGFTLAIGALKVIFDKF